MLGIHVPDITYGEPIEQWCDHCRSHAGYEVACYILRPRGPRHIGVAHGCRTCSSRHQFKGGTWRAWWRLLRAMQGR